MTTEFINKFDKIEEEISEISQKLAKCRREQCEKDHDTMIVIQNEQINMKNNIRTNTEIIDKTLTTTNQLAGNINQITNTISEIVKNDKYKKNFMYTILGGILITIISASIIWFSSLTFKNMMKVNNDDMIILQKNIEQIQEQLTIVTTNVKNNGKTIEKNQHLLEENEGVEK